MAQKAKQGVRFDTAVKAFNGRRQLALLLGVSIQAVHHWSKRGWLPDERAQQVERMKPGLMVTRRKSA